MQQWGRWYSQAPVGGRHFTKKKKNHLPQDEKRLPRTERPIHPSRTTQCILHPSTDQTFSTKPLLHIIQKYSSAAVRPPVHLHPKRNKLVLYPLYHALYVSTNKKIIITGHPPTTDDAVHPPPTHPPTKPLLHTAVLQCVQQYTWYAGSSYFVGS